MPRQQSDSELLREGSQSYHRALVAVVQFRRQVQDLIRASIDERLDEVAATLMLGKEEIREGLKDYAIPKHPGDAWDGSEAEIGLQYPAKPWEARWGVYFFFWVAQESEATFSIQLQLKAPGGVIEKLAALGVDGLQSDENAVWIDEPIAETSGGITEAIQRALDSWIELGRRAGGLCQFVSVGSR